MKTRGNPLGIEATGQIHVDIAAQVKALHERIIDAEQIRASWISKQRILVEQRRGIRPQKTIPWVGSNNDSIPLTDGIIRRWKPNMIGLVMDADPVAFFKATKPENIDAARSAQAFYHWKFHTQPKLRAKLTILADLLAQHGVAWARQGWEFKTGRTCRILRVASLFPGGPAAATEQFNTQARAFNDQLAQLTAQGQVPPDAQPQAERTPEQHVAEALKAEYAIDENDPTDEGGSMLSAAVQGILQGAEYVKIYYETVLHDRFATHPISPLDVVESPVAREDDDPDFIAIVHRMSEHDIRRAVKEGLFVAEKAAEILDRMTSRSMRGDDIEGTAFDGRTTAGRAQLVDALRKVEGVTERDSQNQIPYEVMWEVYAKMIVDATGLARRVILWYHPATATVASILDSPMPFDAWPIVKFEVEKTSNRPYQSRGVAELLTVFQKLTNRMHNSRLDAIQIVLSPMLKVRAVNNELARNIKYRPGTIIPLADVADLQPVVMDYRPLQQFLTEENYTKSLAEQYIGVFDQTISSLGTADRRTATEIETITAQISSVFGGDAGLFQESMSNVHFQLWKLWLEFGPEEEYYRVQGEEQPRMIRKKEVDKDYDIYPAGTPANTNKALAIARAREQIQLFGPDQTGLIDKHALYKNYFDLMDPNFAKVVVRSIEDATAMQQVVQAASQITGQPVAAP